MGLVYSTDKTLDLSRPREEVATPEAGRQELRVWLDRKHRGGKTVTLVKGFVGSSSALEALARELKSRCGVGGAAKDCEIIIQGDHRDRVTELLVKAGYKAKKAGA